MNGKAPQLRVGRNCHPEFRVDASCDGEGVDAGSLGTRMLQEECCCVTSLKFVNNGAHCGRMPNRDGYVL